MPPLPPLPPEPMVDPACEANVAAWALTSGSDDANLDSTDCRIRRNAGFSVNEAGET